MIQEQQSKRVIRGDTFNQPQVQAQRLISKPRTAVRRGSILSLSWRKKVVRVSNAVLVFLWKFCRLTPQEFPEPLARTVAER